MDSIGCAIIHFQQNVCSVVRRNVDPVSGCAKDSGRFEDGVEGWYTETLYTDGGGQRRFAVG